MKAEAYATCFEIFCPVSSAVNEAPPPHPCPREDPIPAPDGSFGWDHVPELVTCPDCGRVWQVKRQPVI